MAEQQGGYRRPGNPAPVSGPGALSQRTDGQGPQYMAGGEYGEGQEMLDIQGSAPMSRAPQMRPSRGGSRGGGMAGMPSEVTPLFDPTQRPDEPITAGAPFGEGPGPVEDPFQAQPNNLEIVLKYLPAIREAATHEGAPDRFRALARYLQGVAR